MDWGGWNDPKEECNSPATSPWVRRIWFFWSACVAVLVIKYGYDLYGWITSP